MNCTGNANGYTLILTKRETENWAHRPNESWPCSTIAGKRLMVVVDRNGLVDCNKAMESVDGHELDAIVSDHLPLEFRHLWPVWGKD